MPLNRYGKHMLIGIAILAVYVVGSWLLKIVAG